MKDFGFNKILIFLERKIFKLTIKEKLATQTNFNIQTNFLFKIYGQLIETLKFRVIFELFEKRIFLKLSIKFYTDHKLIPIILLAQRKICFWITYFFEISMSGYLKK